MSAILDAVNALLHTQPRVDHREERTPEASCEQQAPATQGQREKSCGMQQGAG